MNKPLKVLVYLFFPSGGIGRYTHEVLIELAKYDDLDIEVVCLPEFQWLDHSDYRTWPKLRTISHPNPLLRKARFLIAQWVNPRRMVRHAQQVNADIVHICQINHLTRPWWMPTLKKTGAKVLTSAHDVRRAKGILLKPWEAEQLRIFYQGCDAIFIHGPAQKADLIDYAGSALSDIVEVPFGPYSYDIPTESVADLRKDYDLPQDRRVFLFFGNIRDDKNLDGLITAMAKQTTPVHLLVAGRFDSGHHMPLANYTERIQALGLESQVHILNRFIPDEEVGRLFKLSDAIALPYLPEFTSQSGVLHVAAAFERPILCTPTEIFSDTLSDAQIGMLCPGFDDEDVATGMTDMLRRLDDGLPFTFSAYRENHSWTKNAAITRETYLKLMERS